MKVTAGDLKAAGFKLVVGDALAYDTDGNIERYVVESVTVGTWNKNDNADFDWTVESLASRPNLGTQPVADDCWVEITYNNELTKECKANDKRWHKYGGGYEIKSWKPSLKHLEQQMNKQELAMSISERDIENAFIKQEDAEVERELSESDDWKYGDECITKTGSKVYIAPYPFEDGMHIVADEHSVHRAHVSVLSKPPTPEQLAAKERDEWIDNVCNEICISDDYIIGLMYDAGYRK